MSKSALSTRQIRVLRNSGVSVAKIAKQAGITPQAVRARLSPISSRRAAKNRYQNSPNRTELLNAVKRRVRTQQGITKKHASNHNEPWTDEMLDILKKEGGKKTATELALQFGRTHQALLRGASRHGISLRS